MATPLKHIGVSLGMIDSLSDGLGEFSTQICERIAAAAPAWREQHGVQFHMHMHARWHGRFGDDVAYLSTSKRQGYWHWQGWRRFDVWHSLNQLGRIIPPVGTRRSVLTIHDLNPVYHDSERDAIKSLRKLRRRLRRFDEVTTLTHYVEGDVRKHLRWHGPITVIPNGARDLTMHERQPVEGVSPARYLLHLSRMAASKNVQSLLDMAAIWADQELVLAGPPTKESDQLLAQVRERGLANVRVIQGVSDAQKAWLYANCMGFLFPSLTEGFGLPPIEVMYFGKPVFLSRLTSLPEVGGTQAAYFESFEPHAMRSTIKAEWQRRTANAAAIQAHASEFSWDRAASGYLAIHARMLGLPAPPAR